MDQSGAHFDNYCELEASVAVLVDLCGHFDYVLAIQFDSLKQIQHISDPLKFGHYLYSDIDVTLEFLNSSSRALVIINIGLRCGQVHKFNAIHLEN